MRFYQIVFAILTFLSFGITNAQTNKTIIKGKVHFLLTLHTLISEEYNKYLELYLNFKINIQNKNFAIDSKFNRQKIKMAIKSLPNESLYYYLANHLLQCNRNQLLQDIGNEEADEELITKTITKYPNGELNDKLTEKYEL